MPYKRLFDSTSLEQMAQIFSPGAPSTLVRGRRRFDEELAWRPGDGDRWLVVGRRGAGDFVSSTELRLRERDAGERGETGDGVRLET